MMFFFLLSALCYVGGMASKNRKKKLSLGIKEMSKNYMTLNKNSLNWKCINGNEFSDRKLKPFNDQSNSQFQNKTSTSPSPLPLSNLNRMKISFRSTDVEN
jgi:hypothetical protein